MSRNLHCNCLCHGSDGNRIGDTMFSCKNCYAAMHMGNLPRFAYEQEERKPKKAPRKPKAEAVAKVKEILADPNPDRNYKFQKPTPGAVTK